MTSTRLSAYSDDDLLAATERLWAVKRRVDASMIAHLMEIEDRHLELRRAYKSIYDLCKKRFAMSDGGAWRRSLAVQMVRRHPGLLDALHAGRLTLSSMVLLDRHLTPANFDSLVALAAGKSVEGVKHLLVTLAPRPDVPTQLARVVEQASLVGATANDNEPRRARFEPLGEERYALQTTISKSLHDKLEHARDLMSHRRHDRDVGAVLEAAVDLLVAKLEKERLGKTDRPRTTSASATPTANAHGISQATRREVFARDGARCTYESEDGTRCTGTDHLELDHVVARARGGGDGPDNLRVRCQGHNFLHAVDDFGAAHMAASRAEASVRGALIHLGFGKPSASRTARAVVAELGTQTPLAELLRAAIGMLTAA